MLELFFETRNTHDALCYIHYAFYYNDVFVNIVYISPEHERYIHVQADRLYLLCSKFEQFCTASTIHGFTISFPFNKFLYVEKHCLSEEHVYRTLLVLRLSFLTARNIISQSYFIEYVYCGFINVIIRVIISH